MSHGLWVCDTHRKRFCRECIADDVRRDAAEDRAYREGYRQAWREWSACCASGPISDADRVAMERRLARVERR